ncbi:MAG: PAS domain-containing protein, partial [Planctomycetota bacterium]
KRADGEEFPATVLLTRVELAGETWLQATVRDITERKRAEQAVLRANSEWERTFNSVPDLISIIDDQYRILRVNQAMADRLGLTPAECFGKTCYRAVHGADEPPDFCPHAQTMADGTAHFAELYENGLNGYFAVSTTPLTDADGKTIGSVHVAHDITERKQAEEALRESETRYRALFEGSAEGILVADAETSEFTYANPAICEMFGYTAQEMTQRGVADLHPPDELDRVLDFFHRQAKGEINLAPDIPCLRADGSVFHADVSSAVVELDGRQCAVGFFTDITERLKAGEALRESEQRYRTIFDTPTPPCATWWATPNRNSCR